jgi:hypothetical protein
MPGPLEKLNRRFGAALAAGSANLGELERQWQSAAGFARKLRIANTVIYGLFAAGTVGYGAYLVLAGPIDTPPAEGQYIIGAELIVAGLAHGAHALHDALVPSAVERAWRAHVIGFGPTMGARITPFAAAGPNGVLIGAAGTM